MSATGTGSCGPGPGHTSGGAGSGPSNPRKFSEKIALHTQRQAEETAAFQEVMMDITSTRVSPRRSRRRASHGLVNLEDNVNVTSSACSLVRLPICGIIITMSI